MLGVGLLPAFVAQMGFYDIVLLRFRILRDLTIVCCSKRLRLPRSAKNNDVSLSQSTRPRRVLHL